MKKKLCTFAVGAAALGLLAYAYKDEIKKCYKTVEKQIKNMSGGFQKLKQIIPHKKPIIFYIYDSSVPECCCEEGADATTADSNNDKEAECQCEEDCQCESSCECGCEENELLIEELEKYSDIADIITVDLANDSRSDIQLCENFIERFEVDYVPTVLLLTRSANLIAKLEAPDTIEEVESFIERCLKA